MQAKQVTDFFVRVMPSLVKLGRDLYEIHKGNSDKVIAEIEDRRSEIQKRRAENDAALEEKYDKGGE